MSVAENRRLDVVTCIKCYQAQPALPCKFEEQSGERTNVGARGQVRVTATLSKMTNDEKNKNNK